MYNTGKGFAFVTFGNKQDAQTATRELDGANVCGQQIKVNEARPKGDGGGRGGGGGGYGGGGSSIQLDLCQLLLLGAVAAAAAAAAAAAVLVIQGKRRKRSLGEVLGLADIIQGRSHL